MKAYKDDRSRLLATEPVDGLLRRLALPAILMSSSTVVYVVCNTAFLGQTVGTVALTAMAVCWPLMMLISAIGTLCNAGVASLIAAARAQGHVNQALRLFGNAFVHYFLASAVIMAGGWLFLTPLLRLCGASPSSLPYAADFMQTYLLSVLPLFVFQGLLSIMQAIDDSRMATRIQMCVIALNILLDAICIVRLGMGMYGAALSALVSAVAGAVYMIVYYSNSTRSVFFSVRMLRYSTALAGRQLGGSAARFAISLGGCVIVTVINNMLVSFGGDNGDVYLCAYMIVYCVTQMLIRPVAGLGRGMSSIAGFNYYHRYYNRVRLVMSESITLSTVFMTVGYALAVFLPVVFTKIFISDMRDTVTSICSDALRIGLCTLPFVAAQLIVVSFFSSIHKGGRAMFISISRQMVFLLPMLILLPHLIGVNGVWWAMCLADVYSVTVSWVMLWLEMKNMHESYNQTSDAGEKGENGRNLLLALRQRIADRKEHGIDKYRMVNAEDELREQLKRLQEEKESLELKLLYESSTDALTGLMNRSAGEAAVNRMLASGRSGMFVLFDCDRFKSINDTISHQVGDVVLKKVAKALKMTYSENVCFRLGGDEFVVCMYENGIMRTSDGAVDIDLTFAMLRQRMDLIRVPELSFNVTISGGAVCFGPSGMSFKEIYNLSDKALQESKAGGHHGVITLYK